MERIRRAYVREEEPKRTRRQNELAQDAILRASSPDGSLPCFYCGEPSWGRDHVFPQSAQSAYFSISPRFAAEMAAGFDVDTVPACVECNSLLGAGIDSSLRERTLRLKNRLAERHADLLDMPERDPEWFEGFEGHLRTFLEGQYARREILRLRLAW